MSRAMRSEHQLTDLMTSRPYLECDLGYSSGHAPQNMARARILSGRSPCYQGSPQWGVLKSVKNFQRFTMICHKPQWIAQFVCAPQFFKAPKGLCRHTVFYIPLVTILETVATWINYLSSFRIHILLNFITFSVAWVLVLSVEKKNIADE
jgi:hypothetical protein